jgi:uncharacterized protein YndB with AHSA1/START domain
MTTTKKTPVQFDRTYDAPLQDIWELWTTKEGFESWWGPQGFRVEVREMNPTVGGALFYDMIACGASEIAYMKAQNMPLSHETRGTFTVVEPLQRLALCHMIDFIPGQDPYENNMTVEFSTSPKGSRMLISVDPHPSEQWTKAQVEGMTSQLTKLPAALEARRK